MDLSSLLSALPIGLLVFVFTLFGVKRRQVGWARAARDFPELARELGLELRPPGTSKEIGLLKGNLRGHDVIVDPDDGCKMVVRLRRPSAVLLRTYVLPTRAPHGMHRFDIGAPALDALFKDRFAAESARTQLITRADRLSSVLAPFVEQRRGHLKDMTIGGDSIHCVFDYGRPKHIPADLVRELLNPMVFLAELIDEIAAATERAVPEGPLP